MTFISNPVLLAKPHSLAEAGERTWSIRLRVGALAVAVCTASVAAFGLAAVVEERAQVLRAERAFAQAFLGHLGHMPELKGDLATASAHVARAQRALAALGSALELARPGLGGLPDAHVLAAEPVALDEGAFELRYAIDDRRLREATLRSAGIHVLHGVLVLLALLTGIEWILRRRLVAPVRALSAHVARISRGGGWVARVPAADGELKELRDVLHDFGPELERQVREWIEAERRAGIALAFAGLKSRFREPQRRMLELASQMLEQPRIERDGQAAVRSLLGEIRRMGQGLVEEEQVAIEGPLRPPASVAR